MNGNSLSRLSIMDHSHNSHSRLVASTLKTSLYLVNSFQKTQTFPLSKPNSAPDFKTIGMSQAGLIRHGGKKSNKYHFIKAVTRYAPLLITNVEQIGHLMQCFHSEDCFMWKGVPYFVRVAQISKKFFHNQPITNGTDKV